MARRGVYNSPKVTPSVLVLGFQGGGPGLNLINLLIPLGLSLETLAIRSQIPFRSLIEQLLNQKAETKYRSPVPSLLG